MTQGPRLEITPREYSHICIMLFAKTFPDVCNWGVGEKPTNEELVKKSEGPSILWNTRQLHRVVKNNEAKRKKTIRQTGIDDRKISTIK